jgi:hypothetical protein
VNILDILKPYADRPTDATTDFDEIAPQVPKDVLGAGLADAFRSDRTPAFGDMLGSLFGGSNGQQRAGVLGQLISALGPAILSGVAGGALGRLAQGRADPTQISPADAERITPEQFREIAASAEKADPGIVDRVGEYYAQHPEVFKALGGAALAVVLGQLAQRMRR